MCRKDIAAGVISASYYLPYEMLIILCNTLIAIFTMISKHSRVVMLFYFIGNSYEVKKLRVDAQLATWKVSLCDPLARGESCMQDSLL